MQFRLCTCYSDKSNASKASLHCGKKDPSRQGLNDQALDTEETPDRTKMIEKPARKDFEDPENFEKAVQPRWQSSQHMIGEETNAESPCKARRYLMK